MSAFQPTIKRRESTKIYVGNVPIGGDAPIAVQSMTNTRTTDVEATVAQIKSLERVGADIVRVSVPTMEAAEAFKIIKQQVNVPLVADIHTALRLKSLNMAWIACVSIRVILGERTAFER